MPPFHIDHIYHRADLCTVSPVPMARSRHLLHPSVLIFWVLTGRKRLDEARRRKKVRHRMFILFLFLSFLFFVLIYKWISSDSMIGIILKSGYVYLRTAARTYFHSRFLPDAHCAVIGFWLVCILVACYCAFSLISIRNLFSETFASVLNCYS